MRERRYARVPLAGVAQSASACCQSLIAFSYGYTRYFEHYPRQHRFAVTGLARDGLRLPIVAVVATMSLLALLSIAAYRLLGAVAAIVLALAGGLVILAAFVVAAVRRVRRTRHETTFVTHALEAVPRALFIVDTLEPGRPNRFVNEAFSVLTGYGRDEASGAGFDAMTIFADAAEVGALTRGSATSPASSVTLRRRDGTTVPVKLELRPMSGGDGQRYLVGMLEEVPRATNEQSATARAQAPPATVAAGSRPPNAFLSWLTHELRSPLNACVMWLDVLALAPAADKVAQAVDAIKRNLARQTRLVNDLGDASKIQSATLELSREAFDLIETIKGHIDAWQLLAIGRQLTFTQRVEATAAVIDADAGRVLQAMNHLVENAIASTPSGGRVELRIRLDGESCVIEVEDSGVGLSADDAENLGTPLWRAPATSKSRPGIGLGLAIAHHVVAAHGGTLHAASMTSGALFTLTLPLRRRASQAGNR